MASTELQSAFQAQKAAYAASPYPDLKTRLNRLDRLVALIVNNADAFTESLSADFGHRSPVQSMMADVLGILAPIKYTRKHLPKWIQTEHRSTGFKAMFMGKSRIEWMPRGVVGIIAPWNFPVGLALQPLATAFAAGNRALLKVSEFTPATGELLQTKIAEYFDPTEVSIITGGPEVGAAFSQLPFDLILFTGATSIARHVERAAAENLIPTILELGGKSPVVIDPSANIQEVANRIAFGKTLNAGQICLSPDHVYVPKGKQDEFVAAMKRALTTLYPTLLENEDYTSIVHKRHQQRLAGYLEDAKSKGATLHEVNPANEDFSNQPAHKMAPVLLTNVSDDMLVMQEELFGPLLPIKEYERIEDVIENINTRSRPLALYYFGDENTNCRTLLDRTISGGVTINDVLLHCAHEDLPFGGIGDSGMGYYHGRYGFEAFSHPRSIVSSPKKSPNRLMTPPYRPRTKKLMNWYLNHEKRAINKRLQKLKH
jgi:coniferyl-aldehyde dehydrogenase